MLNMKSGNVKNTNQKLVFEEMPPTYGAFHQYVKRAHLQSLIFDQTDKAVIEMTNLEHFGGQFNRTR